MSKDSINVEPCVCGQVEPLFIEFDGQDDYGPFQIKCSNSMCGRKTSKTALARQALDAWNEMQESCKKTPK